jgi:hypothetical protein
LDAVGQEVHERLHPDDTYESVFGPAIAALAIAAGFAVLAPLLGVALWGFSYTSLIVSLVVWGGAGSLVWLPSLVAY